MTQQNLFPNQNQKDECCKKYIFTTSQLSLNNFWRANQLLFNELFQAINVWFSQLLHRNEYTSSLILSQTMHNCEQILLCNSQILIQSMSQYKDQGQKLSRSESRIFKKLENGVSDYVRSHRNHDLHVLVILCLHIQSICLNLLVRKILFRKRYIFDLP